MEPLQILSSLISLAILRLPSALQYLNGDASMRNGAPAILDVACQTQVTETLLNAADKSAAVSGPAMLAWTLMLRQLSFAAQSQRSGSVASDDYSLRESLPVLSRNQQDENARLSGDIQDHMQRLGSVLETDQDTVEFLGHVALDALQVFSTIAIVSSAIPSAFGLLFNAKIHFNARRSLLELVQKGCAISSYSHEIMQAALATLECSRDINCASFSMQDVDIGIANLFLEDDETLVPSLLQQAQMRYPYESEPFLRLCQSLGCGTVMTEGDNTVVFEALMETPRFTQELPRRIWDREFVGEDDSPNRVQLCEDLPILQIPKEKRQKPASGSATHPSLIRVPDGSREFLIPRETHGSIVSDPGLVVIMWDLQHSALAYFGAWLSTALSRNTGIDLVTGQQPDKGVQAQIINLISSQLQRSHQDQIRNQKEMDAFEHTFNEAGDFLSQEQDFISVVTDLFEEVLGQQSQGSQDGSVELLTSCVRVFENIIEVMPSRIWPLTVRSQLLDINGRGGQIGAVVASTELITGRYDFLISCVSLFRGLLDDVVRNSVSRRLPSIALTSRFEKQTYPTSGVSPRPMSNVILAFSRVLIDVFRSIPDWRFAQAQQRLQLNCNVLEIFQRILIYVYAFDDTQELASKFTGVLVPAAKLLTESFMSSVGTEFNLNPLFRILTTTLDGATQPFLPYAMHFVSREAKKTLQFLRSLLHLSGHLNATPSCLHTKIFSSMPSLIRLYLYDESLKRPVINLLTALVADAARLSSDPPSLLSHLSPDDAHQWLLVLSDLDKPTNDPKFEADLWNFMASVVRSRQKWLATFLLTGCTPRDSLKRKTGEAALRGTRKSLLDVALDSVSASASLNTPCAVAMLSFIANAQNEWPWTTVTIRSHPKFLDHMPTHLEGPSSGQKHMSTEVETGLAHRIYAASLLTEIFAMYIHYMRQLGDTSFVGKLVSRLDLLRPAGNGGVMDPAYDTSMHAHLKSNFEKRLPGCTPANFKRLFGPSELGPSYFYDMDFSNEMLSSQSCWNSERRDGFSAEFMRANCNLSLVESQLRCMRSWKLLASELSKDVSNNKDLNAGLANVAFCCLAANAQSDLHGGIFDGLSMLRADMALTILQRLISTKSDTPVLRKILQEGAWPAIAASGQDFDTAFEGPITPYYRTLLQILLLALQSHTYLSPETLVSDDTASSAPQANSSAPLSHSSKRGGFKNSIHITDTLLSIANLVVAKGVTSLTAKLHETPSQVQPSDLALLTSILHSVLHARGAKERYPDFALALAQSSAIRNAISLFSWSDRLTVPTDDGAHDDDPVYGDLSILLLQELSTVPHLAQHLATEGILTRLDTTPLMSYYRCPPPQPTTNGTARHTLSPQATTRLDRIWSRGILPLLLNLLAAIPEPRFAAETAHFLNGFAPRLRRASTALLPTAALKGITLAAAAEAHTAALVAAALDAQRSYAVAEAVPTLAGWDPGVLREDLEGWLGGRREALRERLVPTSAREAEWAADGDGVRNGSGCESLLEERVVREMEGVLDVLEAGLGFAV